MEYLKEYQTRQMYDLLGVGLIKANEVIMYDLEESDKFKNIDNVEGAFEKLTPVKWWFYDDEDARAFAHMKLDCDEFGRFEKFMLGESTFSHWKLYNKGLEEFNANLISYTKAHGNPLDINEVKKLEINLMGRLWENSKSLSLNLLKIMTT